MRKKKSPLSLAEFAEQYNKSTGLRPTAKRFGISYGKAHRLYTEAVAAGMVAKRKAYANLTNDKVKEITAPKVSGRVRAPQTPKAKVPGRGRIKRYIFTCAQNNTALNEPLWANIQALADHYKAQIIVARTVYNRFAEASELDKKLVIARNKQRQVVEEFWWDKRLTQYMLDERLEVAPGLVWCGETNILPTAANPLAGFEGYTGRPSSIVPHPRIAMRSVASHPSEDTKLMYTTGTLTQRNYIQRKSGQMAEFHHCYGGLLVEVDSDGYWFCRQLNADSEGVIHDLDLRVAGGRVTTGNRIEAVTWGDIHVAYADEVSYDLAWGHGGIVDTLKPRKQFLHDLLDFRARNGHVIKKGLHHDAFKEWALGHNNVEWEITGVTNFLAKAVRDWMETYVVASNHNDFLVEWVYKTGDFRRDPENARYYLEAALHMWQHMEAHKELPNMTEWAVRDNLIKRGLHGNPPRLLKFLGAQSSVVVCPDAHGGIECAMHGHLGPNGARGTPGNYAKMGRKANIGHHHSAGIWDGVYVAGIMGSLKQGYNDDGPGSWSQSNVIVYPNGKRAVITLYDGKWRA